MTPKEQYKLAYRYAKQFQQYKLIPTSILLRIYYKAVYSEAIPHYICENAWNSRCHYTDKLYVYRADYDTDREY